MLRNIAPVRARRASPGRAALFAIIAGFAATGVSAGTLAQPKDDSLERTAANYVQFREDVAVIEAMPFDNAGVTREAHRRLSAYDPEALSAGWVAYAALVAADTPEFANALKKELKKKRTRKQLGGVDGLMSHLAQDPGYARKLDGADKAVEAVLEMTAQDTARITKLGEAFKTQAYAMQKTSWGKKRISSSQERLKEAANYSRKRGGPPAPTLDHAVDGGVVAPVLASADAGWDANWGHSDIRGHLGPGNAQAVMDRVLNLAARYSTGTLNPKIVEVYATNTKTQRCLEMAKLTLDQCIAATRTPYEEAFCLGEHGLNQTASCTGWVAGAGGS